jgi:hypothetical protein
MRNGETKEKFVIKTAALTDKQKRALHDSCDLLGYPIQPQKVAFISRHPLNAGKRWVEANEQEALNWEYEDENRTIYLDYPIKNAM